MKSNRYKKDYAMLHSPKRLLLIKLKKRKGRVLLIFTKSVKDGL